VGLDVEMVIHEHYYEILDVAEELFAFLFGQLLTAPSCRPLLEMVREQHPFARAPRGLRGGGAATTLNVPPQRWPTLVCGGHPRSRMCPGYGFPRGYFFSRKIEISIKCLF